MSFSERALWGWLPMVVVMSLLWLAQLRTRITGVPYVERQSLRSKGDAYREHQENVSMFFPRLRFTPTRSIA